MYQQNLKRFKYIHDNINDLGRHYIGKPAPSKLPHEHTEYSLNQWDIPYASRLSLLNLSYITNVDQVDNAPCFIVRDGLFLTMDFFNRCLKQKELRTLLLFHHGLKDFIPANWEENVLFFEYAYNKKKPVFHFTKQSSKKLILKFNLLKGCFSPEKIHSFLESIDHYQEIILCFSLHETNHFLSNQWDGGVFLHSTYEEIEKIKNKCLEKCEKVSSIPLKSLQMVNDLFEYDFYDISQSEHYYIDDYTNYHCLLSGATPLKMKEESGHPDDISLPLSFNHGIRVLAQPKKKDPVFEKTFQQGLKELSIHPGEKFNISAFQWLHSLTKERTSFSWPKLFI